MRQFSYYTPYQPETPISAREPKALGLIWVSRVDMGYDMGKCNIINYLSTFFLSDKFAILISYAESKARPPSAPNVVIWVSLPGHDPLSHLLRSTSDMEYTGIDFQVNLLCIMYARYLAYHVC